MSHRDGIFTTPLRSQSPVTPTWLVLGCPGGLGDDYHYRVSLSIHETRKQYTGSLPSLNPLNPLQQKLVVRDYLGRVKVDHGWYTLIFGLSACQSTKLRLVSSEAG